MKRKQLKNSILKAITWTMGMLFLVSGSALDSDSMIPCIVCGVSLTWLALFAYANRERGDFE